MIINLHISFMQIRIIIASILISVSASIHIQAQQVPLYSQYMLNGFLLNPALAGSEGYSAINLTAREQWIGLREAPGTYALSYQTRILKNSYISRTAPVRKRMKYRSRSGRVGFGGYVFKDQNAAVERIGLKGAYAYHIYLSQSQLSFGLSLSAYQMQFNESKIMLEEDDDNLWSRARGSTFIPDADFGIYYDTPNFYVGFSAENLLESHIKIGTSGYDNYKMDRNYYVLGGYDFAFYNRLIISPTTLLKYSENGVFQGDISVKLFIDQMYWTGLTYRTENAIIIMAGVSIDRLVLGYAFDLSLSSLMKHSFGTHEIIMAVKMGDSARRYRWLNRY